MIDERALEETFLNLPKKVAILLYGHSGYGKTYQTERLSRVSGLPIVKWPSWPDRECIWFIEEAHKINPRQQERFPEILDEQICIDEAGEEARYYTIFATTNPNKLSLPIRTRCFDFQLTPYKPEEIFSMLSDVDIPPDWKHEIVRRTRLVPRLAHDTAEYAYSLKSVEKCFSNLGIDKYGLKDIDHKYLILLFREGQLSINQIAAKLTVDEETVEEMVEEYFKEVGWINITSRGRNLTDKGKTMALEVIRSKAKHV
jgi:Holliday junction DNA helicase RuvB